MRRASFFLLLLVSAPLHAAEIEAGGQHVIAVPRGDTGELDLATSRGFGAHLDWFWSERVSARLAVVFLNPAAILYPDDPPPTDVDLGTLGLDVVSATARFHLAPRRGLSAFAGGGVALVSVGNLDDQFGDEVEIEFERETAVVAEAGLRYRVHPRIVLEAGAAYLPLELQGEPPLPPTIGIDPLLVSVGAAWRF